MKVSIYKTSRAIASATLVFALALTPLNGLPIASAAVGTQTWDGSAGDGKFSTAANWVENEVPEAGDALIFNIESTPPNGEFTQVIDNDIDVAFASVTSTTSGNPLMGYELSKNLSLQNGGSLISSQNLPIYMGSAAILKSTGSINLSLPNSYINGTRIEVNGVVTIKSGTVTQGLNGVSGVVVENGASFCTPGLSTDITIAYPITLGGGAGSGKPSIYASGCGMGGGGTPPANQLTLNNVTLLADAEVTVSAPQSVKVVTLVKNGHSLTRGQYATGELITADGVQENQPKTTQLEGDDANQNVNIVSKETATLNGVRGQVSVETGGVLKGNGTVDSLYSSGTVAPGNSPGKITVVNNLNLYVNSTFETEILNKDAYDQLVVQSTGAVDITDAKLDLKFLPGGLVNQGETFTIIDNQSNTPINGTFAGLTEGTKITVGNAVFAISYIGGTGGNDVVLTALVTAKAPLAPNSGFLALVQANPIISAAAGITALGALLLASRSTFATATRKK